jgi:hypothetical protein
MFMLNAVAAHAATVTGDWTGAIDAGLGRVFHLAIHIAAKPDGTFTGTLQDVDRGTGELPVTAIAAGKDTLSFTVPLNPDATYTATWDAAAKQWVGQWKQSGQSLPLTLAAGLPTPKPKVEGLDGRWEGTITPGTTALHLVLHVKTGALGTAAWLDSPDQTAYGLAVDTIKRDGANVSLELPAVGAKFTGTLSTDGQTLAGQWGQGDKSFPISFAHLSSNAATPPPARPQTPKKPYPYREEDVTFDDAAAHVRLAGTLTMPEGKGPFPAVVLVAGSGPNTRNEPIMGHQLFLVIADHLTRAGIAVLRFDKRGTGASTGDFGKATTMDFADDAAAAASYLRARPEIDPHRVGLIGHSEGGLIVPIVATHDPATAFIVMMAGPGVNGLDIMLEQGRLIAKAMGMTDAQLTQLGAMREKMFAIVRSEKDPAAATAKLKAILAEAAKAQHLPENAFDQQIGALNSDWFRFFFDYDPAATLAKVKCPVLALNGSLDLQVPPAQNLPAIRAALAKNPDAEVDELPNLNHLFQTAKTGSIGEYGQIEETIAPSAMDLMTRWILKRVGR